MVNWQNLLEIKDKSKIAELVRSGIITEALANIQKEQAQLFLKTVLNPLIFKDPNCIKGILNIFDRSCPHSIRLWVGYLWLEVRIRSEYSLKFQEICDVVHSKFSFSGDTNHHLLYLFIKFDDKTFRPATTSLLMQRMLDAFEIGPIDSFQAILQWLLIKVRSISRIRNFTTNLIIQMAVLCPDWVTSCTDAMDLLVSNYTYLLNADEDIILLLTKLIIPFHSSSTSSCLFALLDKCVSERKLWKCLPYLSAGFRVRVESCASDLPSAFETNYPFLIISNAQTIILADAKNVQAEETFVTYLILIFDLLDCNQFLLNVPGLRESMEITSTSFKNHITLAVASGWLLNQMHPAKELTEIPNLELKELKSPDSLKAVLINFERLYISLITFPLNEKALFKCWDACKSCLGVLAISPLGHQAKKVAAIIVHTISYCLSILFKASSARRAGNS
jgi:hypothetical protein